MEQLLSGTGHESGQHKQRRLKTHATGSEVQMFQSVRTLE